MSEVNYRRNGNKYSSSGKCCRLCNATACQGGLSPTLLRQGYGGQEVGGFASDLPAKGPKPKSSRERRAAKKGK